MLLGIGATVPPAAPPASAAPHRLAVLVEGAAFWSNTSATDHFAIGVQPSSTFGTFGLTLDFDCQVNLTGGALDAGTSRTAAVSVSTPAGANLSLDVLGVNTSLALPAPIGSTVNIPIPGVTYTVPVVGVQLGVELSMTGSLRMVQTVSGPGHGGLGNLSWTGGGSRHFTVTADADAAGANLSSSASAVSYVWSAGLIANGTVPLLGTVTYDLLPFVPLGSFSGSVSNVSARYAVTARPAVRDIHTDPAAPTAADNFTATANETGGAGALDVVYARAPAGCHPLAPFSLACPALSAGNYTLEVLVTDQQGLTAGSNATVSVLPLPPAGTTGAGPSAVLGGTTGFFAILGIAAVAVGALLVFWVRPRRRRPRVQS